MGLSFFSFLQGSLASSQVMESATSPAAHSCENTCDRVHVDFRYGQPLSAGTASASSEEVHFLRGLQTRAFPLESAALRSNQPSKVYCCSFKFSKQ